MKQKLLLALLALFTLDGSNLYAQTDVTSQYITNAGFEGEYTKFETFQAGGNNERYVFQPNGWTVVHNNYNQNDFTCLTSEDKQANSFSSWTMPHSGNQTYWVRLRWGGQTWTANGPTGKPTSIEIQQAMTIPSGVYRLSADLLCYAGGTEANNHTYMKAESSNNSWTIEPTIFHEKNDNNWEKKSMLITSSGSTSYTIKLQCVQNWTGTELISAFDDVTLEKLTALPESPIELTDIVAKGTTNWTNNGATNATSFSNGGVEMVERYYDQHYIGTVSELFVKDLPAGTYVAEVYCQAHCADWNCTAIPEAAGQTDRTFLSANSIEVGIPIVNDKNLTEGPQVITLDDIVVGNDGQLTFKIRNDKEGANWLTFEVKTLKYKGIDLSIVKANYNDAVAQANAALQKPDYANVTGSEKSDLQYIINAPVEETEEAYTEAIQNIFNAITAFQTAKPNYDALVAEIAKAKALGMDESTVNKYAATEETTAATALANTQNLKVAEYEYVSTNYAYGVELGTWTTEGPTGSLSDQHYKGSGNPYLEQSSAAWGQSSWSIKYSQDLTLPAGKYVFKVAGRQANSNSVKLSLVVKNGDNTIGTVSDFPKGDTGLGINISGATDFTTGEGHEYVNNGAGRGWEWRYVPFELSEDATVNVAVNAEAHAEHMWVSFCDATVQTDNEANIALIAYNIALNNAQAALSKNDYANVTGEERTTLQVAIDADATLDKTNKTFIEAATTALNNATTAFTGAKSKYDAFVAAKAFNYPTLVYAATLKRTALDNAQSAEAATSASDADTKTTAIQVAARQYYESHALAEGVPDAVNVTELISNADFTGVTISGTSAGAWTFDQTGGNVNINTNEPFTDGSGSSEHSYFDYYNGSNNNQNVHQVIENLEPGCYLLTATGRGHLNFRNNFQLYVVNKGSVNIPCEGNSGGTFDRGWNDVSLYFVQTETSNVTIGAKTSNSQPQWWGITRFRLVKLPTETVQMTDADSYVPQAYDYANVELTRNLNKGWNPIILPFAVSADELQTKLGDGYEVAAFNGDEMDENGNVTLMFQKQEAMKANTPYLLFAPNAISTELTFDGVQIVDVANAGEVAGTNFTFVGNYTKYAKGESPIVAGDYIMSGGKLVPSANGKNAIKAFRSYLKKTTQNEVKSITITIDGEDTTGIQTIEMRGSMTEGIYNLQGQKVNQAQKGVYIVNGKKVVVK